MKRVFIVLLLAAIGVGLAAAQGVELHGADSTFRAEGLALMWAVWRGADEASTRVVLDIVKTSPAADRSAPTAASAREARSRAPARP